MLKWLCSLMFLGAVHAQAVNIDITASDYRYANPTEFVLENVKLSNMTGKSWARFQWNPQVNAFVMVDAGNMTPTVVGQWDLFFDMNCQGSHGHTIWTLNPDGSGTSGDNRLFRWTMGTKGDFVLTYVTGGRVTYTGRFTGAALQGNFANPDGSVRGCWTATKINRLQFMSPSVPDPRTHHDSSGARLP